jgi:hypothetical protein
MMSTEMINVLDYTNQNRSAYQRVVPGSSYGGKECSILTDPQLDGKVKTHKAFLCIA